jgi:DNA polymerase V
VVLSENSNCSNTYIALVDCNNFYVSCERVFNPAWAKRPIVVLSNNDGCIVSRSEEAKQAGIPMGAPLFKYKHHLKAINAIVLSSNYKLYGEMSERVMNVLSTFTNTMEIYSVDEAWLQVSARKISQLEEYAQDIVQTVQKNTGIPISIGIAKTKVLAKIANRICKKERNESQFFILDTNIDSILERIDVGDIWGIGRNLKRRLHQENIYTALDFKNSNPSYIRKKFSIVVSRLLHELKGLPCLGFEKVSNPRKQIIVSRSFKTRIIDFESLFEAVATFIASASQKLRTQQSLCKALHISIRTSRHVNAESFYQNSLTVRFEPATAHTSKLIQIAQEATAQIYKPGFEYAKAGVCLSEIVPNQAYQLNFFHEGDTSKEIILERICDHINKKFDQKVIYYAALGNPEARKVTLAKLRPSKKWDLYTVR